MGARFGHVVTQSTRDKIAASLRGRTHPEDEVRKRREAQLKYYADHPEARVSRSEALKRYHDSKNRVPTYMSIHFLLRSRRGRASQYVCECGRQARHWSLSWRTASKSDIRFGTGKPDGTDTPFSGNLHDYDPRCVSCARSYDRISVRELYVAQASVGEQLG